MPHVSKKKMGERISKQIGSEFIIFINNLSSKDRSKLFNDFFTKTEKIMLSKRLGLLVMLLRGNSTSEIQKFLKITPQTINRFRKSIENGSHKVIVCSISKPKNSDSIVKFIELLIGAGMPPIVGPGRWRWLNKNFPIKH